MGLWQSFKIAFSMYSVIPFRKIDWQERSMKYAFCFFPLVGVVVGLAVWLWFWISWELKLSIGLTAVVATVIPVLLTGGIHLDGFCDTIDALSSNQSKERKLEILKDSHVGAFAVMGMCVYFLLTFGLWYEYQYSFSSGVVLFFGFILSRSLSGMSSVLLPHARKAGLLRTFSDASKQRAVICACGVLGSVSIAGMLIADWQTGLTALTVVILISIYYIWMTRRQFGGVTGDLAGYFLSLTEWGILLGVVLSQKW